MPPFTARSLLPGLVVLMAGLLPGCGLIFQEADPGRVADGARAGPVPAGEDTLPDADDPSRTGRPAGTTGDPGTELPAGFGTLRQERISVDLRRGELQMRVTPLAESVTRTAAPDTWERLSALARSHREIFRQETGSDAELQLFLVAVYSETETLPFEPGALTLVSQGVRHRPLEIRGLTPGWVLQRVAARETQMAVYAYPSLVDLEGELAVEYQDVRSREWERVLPEVQAERSRIRARAGG
jgi:hypothetical protein